MLIQIQHKDYDIKSKYHISCIKNKLHILEPKTAELKTIYYSKDKQAEEDFKRIYDLLLKNERGN